MPELPEVETVVRGLREHVVGRTIISATIFWPKTVQKPDLAAFIRAVSGRTIESAGRRGKYIVLRLDSGDYLTIHLRMTGKLLLAAASAPPRLHTRVVFALDDSHEMHFVDLRKFGRIALLAAAELAALDARLGPEPLTDLSASTLAAGLAKRKIAIKSALLDQSVLAGVGNIYADEALFRAGIHPQRPANTLSTTETERLLAALQSVLATAVTRHGTTLSDEQFIGLQGRMGENQGYLTVFRRTGAPCPECATPIERVRLGGRSTHFCPHCQT